MFIIVSACRTDRTAKYRLMRCETYISDDAALSMWQQRDPLNAPSLEEVNEFSVSPELQSAAEYVWSCSPGDPHISFNMACSMSKIKNEDGCLHWYDRLIAAEPKFKQFDRKLQWMSRM